MGEGGAFEWVKNHPVVLLGGALALGLVLFLGKGGQQPDTGVVDVTPTDPAEPPLTQDDLLQYMAQYDEEIRAYIAQYVGENGAPSPVPVPLPYPAPAPNPGPNPGPGPGPHGDPTCPPGYHWDGARDCVPDHPGPLPRPHFCPPGYRWDDAQGMCVRSL